MKISQEEVQNIARLARLTIAPEHLEQLAEQFGDILDYMDSLEAVDTSAIEPLYTPFTATETPTRVDATHVHCTRQELLANAPENDGEFFVVPRIV